MSEKGSEGHEGSVENSRDRIKKPIRVLVTIFFLTFAK